MAPAASALPDDADRRTAIVLAGGDDVDVSGVGPLPAGATVIAADSGLALAAPLGLAVDLVVGDLDSADPRLLAEAQAAGVPVERHPVDKDRTDLAIALDVAKTLASDVVVVGGHGGRLDHLLANAALLASPAYASVRLVAHVGPATLTVVRREATIEGTPGELVSLVPMHGTARGVTTEGLRFPLDAQDLSGGSSRGVSNVLIDPRARVRLTAGVLLVVQPEHRSAQPPDRPAPATRLTTT